MISPPQLPRLSIRQIIMGTLGIVSVAFAFWLIFRFHAVFFILFVAVVISTAIRPVVIRLNRRGIRPLLGTVLVFTVMLALLGSFVLLGLPLILEQIPTIANTADESYQSAREAMLRAPNLLLWRLGKELPPQLPFVSGEVGEVTAETDGEETITTVAQAWQSVRLVASAIFGTIATLVLAFYWTLDGERTKRSLLLLVPLEQRPKVQEVVQTIEEKVARYIIGQATLSAVIAIVYLIAYLLIGLPYALILAIISGLAEAVPLVGPFLGVLPAVVVAFSVDPAKLPWIILAALIVQQLENYILVPRIMDRAVGVNPLVTLMALIAFSSFFGVIGAIIAIPMAAVIQLLLDEFLISPALSEQRSLDGRDQITVLRYETQELVHDVRKQVRKKGDLVDTDQDEVEEHLEAIASDLDRLLAQTAVREIRS